MVEPRNFTAKFPDPGVLIGIYVTAATLIEAYWKSVQMPGQGIFVGEPLARPFGGYDLTSAGDAWVLKTQALRPGLYRLEGTDEPVGPYRTLGSFRWSGFDVLSVRLPRDGTLYYRIVPAAPPASLPEASSPSPNAAEPLAR